jgi:hypothetical protein
MSAVAAAFPESSHRGRSARSENGGGGLRLRHEFADDETSDERPSAYAKYIITRNLDRMRHGSDEHRDQID